MIRIISILVGLFFSAALLWSFGNGAATVPWKWQRSSALG